MGDMPKEVVNGIASTPTVAGHVRFFDCCESAHFLSSVPSFDYKIYVEWSVSYGEVPVAHPVTLDLAHLPPDWRVSAYLSCANGMGCDPSPDEYSASLAKNDGLAGVLAVQRASSDSSLYEMSLCLVLQEQAAHPHPPCTVSSSTLPTSRPTDSEGTLGRPVRLAAAGSSRKCQALPGVRR